MNQSSRRISARDYDGRMRATRYLHERDLTSKVSKLIYLIKNIDFRVSSHGRRRTTASLRTTPADCPSFYFYPRLHLSHFTSVSRAASSSEAFLWKSQAARTL